jgi:hypothetical protein
VQANLFNFIYVCVNRSTRYQVTQQESCAMKLLQTRMDIPKVCETRIVERLDIPIYTSENEATF